LSKLIKKFINKIIIGTWSLSGDLGFVSKKEVERVIKKSIDLGFCEFDIAPTYGKGFIDEVLSNYKDKSLKINTKCGYNLDLKKTFDLDDIKKSLDRSIKFHGHINVFFLHNPRFEIKNWDKLISFFNNLKKLKLIKHTGISLARDFYFSKKILNSFDYIQDEINLLRIYPINKLKFINAKIIARSPLATGILSNNFYLRNKFDKNDYRFKWLRGERLKNIFFQKNQLKHIFKNTLQSSAYSFLLNLNKIDKVIFGVKNITHLNNLLSLDNFKKIESSKLKKLIFLANKNYYLDKNKQGY